MTSAPAGEAGHFPALDAEPPRPSRRQRGLAAGRVTGGVVVLGAVVWLIVAAVGAGGSGSSGSGTGGRIAFLSSAGVFGLASPDGKVVQSLPSLGAHSVDGFATGVGSPDDRVIVTGEGDVFSSEGGVLSDEHAHLDLGPSRALAFNGPFADADQDVVVFDGSGPSARVTLVNWRTGAAVQLGMADQVDGAAGDPAEAGAFVSVNLPPTPAAGWADSRVELRDAGAGPKVIATAAALNAALAESAGNPVVLAAYPDPAGDKVAIIVDTGETAPGQYVVGPSVGLVLVSRTGRILATLPSTEAPETGARVTWSPNGDSMAFVTGGFGEASALVVWSPGVGYENRPLPDPTDIPTSVMWSPDSTSILVTMDGSKGNVESWVTGPARSGTLSASTNAPGTPIAWLAQSRH